MPPGNIKAHFSFPWIKNSDEVTLIQVRGCAIAHADHGDGWAYFRLEENCLKETRIIYKFEHKKD